ncbi:MAG: type VI secretion system tip protein VgrG [Alteromonadaceae bacterium]|nr:MAG: type VI secretion system tip protein VgrG [Alteromonadaceae bacterium]
MSITQENRSIAISDFSLGTDALILTSFSGSEYISDLFEFQICVMSENQEIAPDTIVGKSGTVTLQDEHQRTFHGFIRAFSYGEINSHNYREYRLTMVPWMWFLSRTNNHRIFQEKTAQDIITKIFSDYGFSDYQYRAAGGAVREYCVQHNESDLHFVSRLLEEEGIAYYFKHEAGKHDLILVDQANAYEDAPQTDLEYTKGSSPKEQISRWQRSANFKKGQWTLSDYNFHEPSRRLYANTTTTSSFANNAKFEHYEYAAMHDFATGDPTARIRQEAEEADIDTISATSDCSTFYAGAKFRLAKHESSAQQGEYIITSIHHDAYDESHKSEGSNAGSSYLNNYTCIPSDVHFRPQQRHKRPYMRGPQSAIVTGPSGEEIYVDAMNRVKVQFYWDRDGVQDENTTCFIRVMQFWAGNGWGSSFIPRIGHEVIVDFIDGDPDRPIITGTVYNGRNSPPFGSKTQSGIRTRSSKNGSGQNSNELRFDDATGAEQIYVHAEKNLDTEVENDETLLVENDRTKTVVHDENSNIQHDRNKTVDNNQTEVIGKNKTIDVGENHAETIGKNVRITVGENHEESIGKNSTIDVADNHAFSVGKNITIDIADNHTESVGKDMTIDVTKNLSETVGGQYRETVTKEYRLTAKKIALEADDEILFKTGSAKILMKSNGDITIQGANINVKGSGNVVIKGSQVKAN